MSWQDWIFGNLPPRPQHPASRGALLGAGYQGMPDTRIIDDRRQDPPPDVAEAMRNAPGALANENYWASPMGGVNPFAGHGVGYDPMLNARWLADPSPSTGDQGSYRDSYPQNMRPGLPANAPYRRFPVGPNLPRGNGGWDTSAGMPYDAGTKLPYIGPHLPISPGDPGWSTPPSPSGPHNPGGDPQRPGYGGAIGNPNYGMSPQQLWQLWQGGGQ
jgi:hypothetical protein